jgi:hypothetical protein
MSLPIPHILTLQLKLKKKLGLLLMFSLGLLYVLFSYRPARALTEGSITIISIIRIKSLQAISFTDVSKPLHQHRLSALSAMSRPPNNLTK